MKCPNCGFDNFDDSHFCEACGTPLTMETPETDHETPTTAIPEATEEHPAAEYEETSATVEAATEAPIEEEAATEAPIEEEAATEAPIEEETQAEVIPEPTEANPFTQESETAPKKRNLKLPLIIGGCVVAALVIAFLVFRLVMSAPLRMVAEGLGKSVKAIRSEEVVKTATSILQHGGITVTADGKRLGEALDYAEIDGSAEINIYTNIKDKRCAVSAEVYAGSSKLADGLVWAGQDSIGVSSRALLGNTAYGVNLKNIKSTLPGSVFNPDNDTYYGIPEELYETLMNAGDASEVSQRLIKESKSAAKSAALALEKTLKENAEIKKSSAVLSFNGADKKMTAVTLTADGQAIFSILMDMLDWADSDEALKKLIADVDSQLETVMESYYGASLTDEFDEFIEDAYDEEAWLEDRLEEVEISIVFYISKSGKQLVGMDLSVDNDGDKTKCSAKFGPDLSAPDEISFSFKDDWDKYTGEYIVSERSSKLYEASLKLKEDKETVTSGSISWDKKTGDLKISLTDTLKLKGTMLKKGTSTTLDLKSLSYSDYWDTYEFKNPGVVLTLEENAKYPTVPEYKDLLLYTDEEEFETLLDDISDTVYDAVYSAVEELDIY